ncbi:alpha/beta hydrolase [Hyphomicrobium methylovorum]|uniref:alpha/beta fold hydrolase n=1 Tax=Hyphomicrobium methylovorum TaxID=84 RepID=UPI0015E75605|nr:alpha/beta hydrolase [Hyphomicrobium methylovorum]MBA2126923.1 alpha/beta hydrolase [Hyphomicrobium methylovorum]
MADDAKTEIVLLPGLDGTGQLFDRLERDLSPRLTVTAVSYPNDASLGYAGYSKLVCELIGKRNVILLGESFSGPVAVRVAAQLGQQIESVVLAATFLKYPYPGWLLRRAARVDPETTPVRLRNRVLMGSYGDPELEAKVDGIVRNLSRPVRAARLCAIADIDVRDDFTALKVPVLALHGRQDLLIRRTPIQRAVSRKGGARMIVLPAAHMLLQTRARECAAEILSFVSSYTAAKEKR